MSDLKACHCCGQIQRVTEQQGMVSCCHRCFSRFDNAKTYHWSRNPAIAFALAAIILYFPAILLPILKIEQFGYRHASSLLSGTFDLIMRGNWFVGVVVLLFSIVLPFAKILGILELSLLQFSGKHHRAWVYRFVEAAGRWGMMDVLLLALLVMMVKLGEMVQFELGPAVFVFVACVACNMLASIFFNPHSVWDNE